MSSLSISSTPSTRLLPAVRLSIVLALSLALWLGLGWGLVAASRLPAATGADGVAGDVGGGVAYAPALQGTCDITVTTAADSGPGSLRQAIADVCDGGRITFAGNTTIYLTTTLEISRRLTIDGGTHAITVSGDSGGDGTPNVRVFHIASSGVATLTRLSIVNGTTTGGDYPCPTYCGGGISNEGTLTVQNSILSSNSASRGGGISNWGGTLTLQDSTLSGNSANSQGGGIYSEGILTVQNSILSSNSASRGGGISNWGGTLTLQDSTLSGNSANSQGGGIYSYYGTLMVRNCTLSGNWAYEYGGGLSSYGISMTVQNSTLSGNSVTRYEGGGIYSEGTLTVRSSTLSGNSAFRGGGLYSYDGPLYLFHTLIANNPRGGDCAGWVTTNDHNLIASTGSDACYLTNGEGGSLIGVDPRLGPLADHGGSTPTYALLPGSPAIDAGNDGACLAADQRGVARPQGAACDIGAFESQGFSLALIGGNNQSAPINAPFAQPLSVAASSVDGAPVGPGGVISFTAPGAGASLAPALQAATTNAGGAASLVATANGLVGGYTVTATARGADMPVTFTLTNTSAPAMAVLGNGQAIADGDTIPSPDDGTDFGYVPVGQSLTRTFTIFNYGTENLNLTGSPRVSIAGPAALDFSLVASPALTVAPSATTTFQVRFAPSVSSLRVATLTIASDDPVKAPYDFAIWGMACGSTVTNAADSGAGSLRQAIATVCDGGHVIFDNNYTIYLNTTLEITRRLTIDGGAHTIVVSGDSGGDGTPNVRVFLVQASGVATLTHLSVVSGTVYDGSRKCPGDCGGGIANMGTLTVRNSTLSGNAANWGGGGIFNLGTLTVRNSTFSNNSAADGGGIENRSTLKVQNSTFSGNSASDYGGGIEDYEGTTTVQNSTFSGNSAGYNGGGLETYGGTLAVQNSTFSGNSAYYGGGISSWDGTFHLSHTLIANSPSGGDCDANVDTNDHNLIADGSCSPAISGDPYLGPLASYGGSTLTYALLPGSPAIDAGAACLATDQRGVLRPQGAACDIGAFESRGFGLALAGGNAQSTLINTAFAQPLSITTSSVYGEPVGPGGVITFTAPGAGASLAPAVLTATTDAGGAVSVTVTANALAGSYGVTATAAGVSTPVTFTLTNTLPPAPAMAVLGSGQVITDGDTTPSATDSTDFGGLTVGQALTHTFAISNDGTAGLTLTGSPRVSIGGPAALDFSLVVSPALTVAPGVTTTFQVRFTPSLTGTRVATVTIANDDPARNPYDFAIQGQGTVSGERPVFLPVILRLAQ